MDYLIGLAERRITAGVVLAADIELAEASSA